jgi:hypothetical protein
VGVTLIDVPSLFAWVLGSDRVNWVLSSTTTVVLAFFLSGPLDPLPVLSSLLLPSLLSPLLFSSLSGLGFIFFL